MRIAVDAMGGDTAPRDIVAGTVDAARRYQSVQTFYLVGNEEAIRAELAQCGEVPASVEVRHASEVVEMDEPPAIAVRRKRDSSIARAVELVKEGEAEALFSAGNTGAAVAATTLKLRTLEGVERPAIATVFPTPTTPFVLLDAGANTDCTPTMLIQFAIMGMVFSREILGCPEPSIGLLNIGGEDAKGNETTKETFGLLEKCGLHFVGNVESKDLFEGRVDVVVCDGFVGNVVLKTAESVASAMGRWIKQELTRNPVHMLGAMLLRRGLVRIKAKASPEAHGGAPLLGANGVCIIGHGSSTPLAVCNAIGVATTWVQHKINHLIEEEIVRTDALLWK